MLSTIKYSNTSDNMVLIEKIKHVDQKNTTDTNKSILPITKPPHFFFF